MVRVGNRGKRLSWPGEKGMCSFWCRPVYVLEVPYQVKAGMAVEERG